MTLQMFTLIHVLISLVGIASGFGVLAGLMAGRLLPLWTALYLLTTIATSVTGFLFPFNGITPGIVLGVISLVVLTLACYSLYVRHLAGIWRKAFVFGAVMALYLNVFVLIVQLFQKMPALASLAPTQTEPPFAVTQGLTLLAFLTMGVLALIRFRDELRTPLPQK